MKNLILLLIIVLCSMVMMQSCSCAPEKVDTTLHTMDKLKTLSAGERIYFKNVWGRYDYCKIIENDPERELMILSKTPDKEDPDTTQVATYKQLIDREAK